MPNNYQWRAFVGPAFEPAGSAYAFDFAAFAAGAADPTAAQTTLAAVLADGATTASVVSAANFAAAGGLWIGPNGAGQAWEYTSYSSKGAASLNGLRREAVAVREHNGAHGAGATARQWWELAGNDGRWHLAEELDSAMATITLTAEMAGFLGPQAAIRPGHLVAVQQRSNPLAAWGLYMLGFIEQPRLRDDYRRGRQWSLRIVSLAQVLAGYTAKPIRVGALDLAASGGARSSTPLAMPSKEFLSGEFGEADPDLSAQSAIDGDPATLWLAEAYRGTTPSRAYPRNESPLHPGVFACTLRIARWPGEAKGYRWIEILTPEAASPNVITNGFLCCNSQPATTPINFDGIETSPGQVIAIVENQARYEEANPLANPAAIFEIGAGFFDSLNLAGDAVAIFADSWRPTVAWGAGGQPKRAGSSSHGAAWTTNTITPPGPGQIMRYRYLAGVTQDNQYFLTDYVDLGGYTPADVDDPWIQIDLPRLGLSVRDDMAAGNPAAGQKLYIVKGGAASTEGLTATGTIQIGLEQITYTARQADGVTVGSRGANGTTAASHKAGDLVRVVDSDGAATEGMLVSRIEWDRNGRAPYPAEFRIRRSNADSARVPEDENHGDDYEQLVYVDNHAATSYSLTLSPARRCTVIILEIDRMSVDPSRPRLNAIRAIADPGQYDGGAVLASATAAQLIVQVLANAGAPLGALTMQAGTLDVGDLTTAAGESAWSVAADLAAKTSTLISVQRTGGIVIGPNLLPGGSLSPAFAVTNVTAAQVETAQASSKAYGQARQPYILPDGTKGIARYPTVLAAENLPVLELAETRYASAAAAQAAVQRAYILARWPVQFVVELAEAQPALRPGTVVSFAWQFADDMQPVARVGVVLAADHEIEGGKMTTVITVAQVDREANG